jgi:DNA-binding response OmpR family regulator
MELREILLVDMQAPIVSVIGSILQSKGHLVVLAPDVETAAEELDNYHFDLILAYLTGDAGDKLDLLRRAKERSPQSKVIVAGNPQRMILPIEAFQVEVDDYLLAPFSPPELCRRVDQCLNNHEALKVEAIPAEKTASINERLLNALRLKFYDIHNSLCSLIAYLKIVVQENPDVLDNGNFSQANDMSNELLKLININEDFLHNHLFGNFALKG